MKPGYRKKTKAPTLNVDSTGFINLNQGAELVRELGTRQEFYEIEPARVTKVLSNPYDPDYPNFENGSPDFSVLGAVFVRLLYSQKGVGQGINSPVKPLSPHIVQIPLVGEIVNVAEYNNQLYYFNPLNTRGLVSSNSDIYNDENFHFDAIKYNRKVFPKVGDTIFQGRYGQSVHFSSDENHTQPNIKITVGQKGKSEKLNNSKRVDPTFPHITNVNNDQANIYITTNEHVPLKTGFKSLAKGPKTTFNQAMHSNIVLNADSLIFNAKKKKINMFAPTQIAVSSNIVTLEVGEGKVELGNIGANNAVVGENELDKLITDLTTDLGDIISDIIMECQSIVIRLPLDPPPGKRSNPEVDLVYDNLERVATSARNTLNRFSDGVKDYFKNSNVFMAPKSKLDGNVQWEKSSITPTTSGE